MIYYKCYCNECKSNDKLFKYYNFVIWKKIKNIHNNNIIWKKNTWFSYRGYLNNENMYLKYVWGSLYIKEKNNISFSKAIKIPLLYQLILKIYFVFDKLFINHH